jgi:peroxiredoxin
MRFARQMPVVAAALLASAGAARAGESLELGDRPPEIDVSDWVQGAPITLADGAGKRVFLVEFWATFESDCTDQVGRLDGLHDKYKDKGLEIVAISTEPADDVKQFVAEHKCGYRVASDPNRNTVGVWAPELRKYPMAWLVDKEGVIVWKGDLSGGSEGTISFSADGGFFWSAGGDRTLEEILPDVLAGKFDWKKAQEAAKRKEEMNEAQWRHDYDTLATLADKALAENPLDLSAFDHRCAVYTGKDDREGYAKFVRAFVDRAKEDPKILDHVAEKLSGGGMEWRDMDFALSLARRAVAAGKSADAGALTTYATILHTCGLLEQAIEQQRKVCALEEKNEQHKKTLAFYEQCLAVKKKASATPGK